MQLSFALRNISRNRRRSYAAIGSVAVGVFGLLFLQTFFAGLLKMHAENSIHSRHGHGQVMSKGYWEQSFEKPHEHWLDNPAELTRAIKSVDGVEEVFPRVSFFALLSNGETNVAGKGTGIDGPKEAAFFNRKNFISGGPIKDHEQGIIIGKGLAKSLNVKVGDKITVLGNSIYGTVNAFESVLTGIFHVGMKEADDLLFEVSIKQAQAFLDTTKIESLVIGLRDPNAWRLLYWTMRDQFSDIDILSVYEIDQAWAENGRLFLTALLNVFRLTFIGMILLAIYNSAANSVLERQRELGMLRANGESHTDLAALLLIEGAALSIMGSLIGVMAILLVSLVFPEGIIMPPTPGTNRALPIKLALDSRHLITAVVLGVGASVLATLMSTAMVSRLSIVQALRTPS